MLLKVIYLLRGQTLPCRLGNWKDFCLVFLLRKGGTNSRSKIVIYSHG